MNDQNKNSGEESTSVTNTNTNSSSGTTTTIQNDQILAHFHEITHLDDFEQCQAILESTNWNLDQAIQSYFTSQLSADDMVVDESSSSSSNERAMFGPLPRAPVLPPITNISIPPNILESFSYINNNNNINIADTSPPLPPPPSRLGPILPAPSLNKRLLVFHIEYMGTKFTLHVQDSEKVLKLKELIEERINVPRESIRLNGWRNKQIYVRDHQTLSELSLPLETNLYVVNISNVTADGDKNNELTAVTVTATAGASSSSSSTSSSAVSQFELYFKLLNRPADDRAYHHLNFDPEMTFIEIRRKVYMLTNILVGDQEWWFYPTARDKLDDSVLDDFKSIVDEEKLYNAINDDKLLGISVNTVVEDSSSLCAMKKCLDELSSSHAATDSKLTPAAASSSSSVKMFFVVSNKNPAPISTAAPTSTTTASQNVKQQSADSSNDFEDYDEDFMVTHEDEDIDEQFANETDTASGSALSKNKKKPLISSECPPGDELVGTNMFREEFLQRYGPVMPLFYTGKLDDAIRDALMCPAKDRRLLGIYLHSDNTVFCNIFCSKTLCDENVINFLSSNFVVWPWDLTVKANEAHLYETCSRYLGSVIVSQLKTMREKYPLFLIVTRVRATNEVAAIIEGECSSETFLTRLMQTYEMFEMQRMKDEKDEKTRDERERIKREQDAAYQASLEFDKAKRQRQTEDAERQKRQAEIEMELERKQIEQTELKKLTALSRLPDEPPADGQITRIRFRLPDGEIKQRRFLITDKLSVLIDYMVGHGYFVEEYKLLSSWPRRDLTIESADKTLQELKLFPQETLTLEQR